MIMDAAVILDQRMRFTGTADTGHEVVMDSDSSVGGDNTGPRPMELILIGLCGCTAMDVISILRKKRAAVSGLEVKAHTERAASHPKVFTDIHLEYIVSGNDVSPKAVERAIKLSAETYCPAQAMLALGANMTTSYTIIEEA
jgi:putative redox protein